MTAKFVLQIESPRQKKEVCEVVGISMVRINGLGYVSSPTINQDGNLGSCQPSRKCQSNVAAMETKEQSESKGLPQPAINPQAGYPSQTELLCADKPAIGKQVSPKQQIFLCFIRPVIIN